MRFVTGRRNHLCRWSCALALTAAGLPVSAQDSVSATNGLPGDAVSIYQAGAGASEQINNYIVDLAPLTTSWGNRYRIGPLAKASRSGNGQYFDQIIGAQTASVRFASGPMPRPSYALWTAAGEGVNAIDNTVPGSSLTGTGRYGFQFCAGFMEFGPGGDGLFGTGDDENAVIATQVGFQRRNPERLLVSRIAAASNKSSLAAAGTASFGLGGIDAAGNLLALGDSYGMTDSLRLGQRVYLRINAAARNPLVNNQIFDGGASDSAASTFVRSTNTSMTTPTLIPSSIGAAGRSVAIGLDFNGDYLFESALNTTQATKAYLPGAAGSPRGTLSFTPQPFTPVNFGGVDAGVGASLIRTDSNTRTRGINLFGINTDGSVDAPLTISLPILGGQLLDPTDNWNPATNFSSPAAHEFTSYSSQTPFRGGNGAVATTVLPSGELLAAAVVNPTSGSLVPQSQDNYLVVAKVTTGAVSTWVTAAHTGNLLGAAGGISKIIQGDNGADGLPGTSDAGEGDGIVDTGASAWIGRLCRISEAFPTQTSGPSISAPAMDRAGNLYFMATVALKQTDGSLEYTSALLRGNRDPALGSYRLELLARLGDVFPGLNSARNYQVQFMGFADGDSAASGGLWSGNIVADAIAGPTSPLPAFGNPLSLGALVFRAKIVYDVDADGFYADPSAGASNSHDQAYNVAMVLMPQVQTGDFNLDGFNTVQDIFDFLAAYFGGGPAGDWNGDGAVSVQDIFDFLADYFGA